MNLKFQNIWKISETLFKLKCTPGKFPTANNDVIRCVIDLQGVSDVVNHMDSLILAHPITDDAATHFYTNDSDLKNYRVQEYVKKLKLDGTRTQGLNIPEDFTGE